MKNSIFFNTNLGFDLLQNEEAQANSIWLFFRTTTAANQILHIKSGFYTYDFALESNTPQEFEIPERLWAEDADIIIWLTNNNGQSPEIFITFPEKIDTDMAVEQTDDTHFFIQASKNEAQELRAQVIATTNAVEISAHHGILRKIIDLPWISMGEGTTGIFNVTVACEVSDIEDGEEENLEIHFRYNQVYDEVFIPQQTVHNGKYIITINYPILNMVQHEVSQMQVYLTTSGGTITIPQQHAKASIMASGLLDTNKFTGEIIVEEIISIINIGNNSGIKLKGISETISVLPTGPEIKTLTTSIERILLKGGMSLAGIAETFVQSIPVSTLIWEQQPGAGQGTGADEYTWDALKQSFIWGENS